jgi:hypothetical protein
MTKKKPAAHVTKTREALVKVAGAVDPVINAMIREDLIRIHKLVEDGERSRQRREAMKLCLVVMVDSFALIGATDLEVAEAFEGAAERMRKRYEDARQAERKRPRR